MDVLEGDGEALIGGVEVGEHALPYRAALLDQIQAVDHRAEDGGIGAQELDLVLAELPRTGIVDLKDAVGALAGHEDRHVDQRHHAGLLHEGGNVEPVFLGDVLRDDGLAGPDRIGFRRALVHRQANPSDDVRPPSDPGPQEELLPILLDLEDLGPSRSERLAHQTAGLHEHLVEILRANGEFAEIGEHLLALHQFVTVGHRISGSGQGLRPGPAMGSDQRTHTGTHYRGAGPWQTVRRARR